MIKIFKTLNLFKKNNKKAGKNRVKSDQSTDIESNRSESICKQCRACGCNFSPNDFREVTFDVLKTEILKGYISIAFDNREEGYETYRSGLYYLRVRNKGARIIDTGLVPMDHKGCILLSKNKCTFSELNKPTGGQTFNPRVTSIFGDISYDREYTTVTCADDWEPYQVILEDLVVAFAIYRKNYPCNKNN